jgi:hypothetical protein
MYWHGYLFTYLLTYLFTELSPSWGATNWVITQDLPSTSWNPKVQYRVHKSPILSHINSIHTIPSYLSKIHFNSVHPSTSCWLSHQYPLCSPVLPIRAKYPAHLITLDLIILGEEYKTDIGTVRLRIMRRTWLAEAAAPKDLYLPKIHRKREA